MFKQIRVVFLFILLALSLFSCEARLQPDSIAESPSQQKASIPEFLNLDSTVKLDNIPDLISSGKIQLSEQDGTKCIKTAMGDKTELTGTIDISKMQKNETGVLVLDIFDLYVKHMGRHRILIEVLKGKEYMSVADFYINGFRNSKVHFKNAVWRRRIAFIEPAKIGQATDYIKFRIKADVDISIKGIEYKTVDKAAAGTFIKTWEKNCLAFSLAHAESVILLGLLEDELRQYERGVKYTNDKDTSSMLRKELGRVLDKNELIEKFLDSHYYNSPVMLANNKISEYERNIAGIKKNEIKLKNTIQDLRLNIEQAAQIYSFSVRHKHGVHDCIHLKGRGKPFEEHIAFYMYANSTWRGKGLSVHNPILYDVIKMYGMEGRSARAQNMTIALREIEDDKKYGCYTIMGMLLFHTGLGHRIPEDLYGKYGDEILRHTPAGPAKKDDWSFQGNIFYPAFQEYTQRFASEVGSRFSKDNNIPGIIIATESQFTARTRDSRTLSAGFSESAKKAWHKWLKRKYGSIHSLNKRWDTSYIDFSAIGLGVCSRMEPDKKKTALTYEFETFRKDSFADYITLINSAVKKAAPDKLTWVDPWGRFNQSVCKGMDFLKMFAAPDIVHTHQGADVFLSSYNYMFRRYLNKIVANGEFTHAAPEGWRPDSLCSDVYNAVLRNIWNEIAWDTRCLVLWPRPFFAIDAGGYHLLRHDGNYILPTRQGGAVRVMKEKVLKFESILFNTQIKSAGVAIMQPSTSLIMEKIADTHWVCTTEAVNLSEMLYNQGMAPQFVAEEYIAAGKDKLDDFAALIIPHATYVDERLDQKLLDWMQKGGTIISVGPYGLYNQYGRENRTLLRKTLGDVDVNFVSIEAAIKDITEKFDVPGWLYSIKLNEKTGKNVQISHQLSDGAGIVEVPYGKGNFIMSAFSLDAFLRTEEKNGKAELREFLTNRIESAVTNQFGTLPAKLVKGKNVGLVLREDKRNNLYVVAINQSSSMSTQAVIEVNGVWNKVQDMTIGNGLALTPVVQGGKTRFSSLIAPGEGIVFKLEH